jgi:chemotaxis protein MotB
MSRHSLDEDTDNHERWLVSYADFMTLLMAFFVVMYSISQVNESKYRVLSNTLTEAFNNPELSKDPIQVGDIARSQPLNVIDAQKGGLDEKHGQTGDQEANTDSEEKNPLQAMAQRLEDKFADLIGQQKITVHGNEEWLEIELKSELLFKPGAANIQLESELILQDIATILVDYEATVRVEGFTDNKAIQSDRFPSNWELSAGRAASVVKMLARMGLDPHRMAAVGYGEFQPRASNSTEAGRAANRRVVLMVSRTSPIRVDVSDKPTKASPPKTAPIDAQGQDIADEAAKTAPAADSGAGGAAPLPAQETLEKPVNTPPSKDENRKSQ